MKSNTTQPDRIALARLLREAGSSYDLDGVEALLKGVLAAPAGVRTSWHALVADPMPQELATQLEALRAALAADYHDGLAAQDFERLPRAERRRSSRRAVSTVSSCHAPTSIKVSTCHPVGSVSHGSRDLPDLRAWRSCYATAQLCLSM